MAGARSTAESLASRAASASAGQMQRQRPQRLVTERVTALTPLVCQPSADRTGLEFSPRDGGDSVPAAEFEFRTLFPQVDKIRGSEKEHVVEEIVQEPSRGDRQKKAIVKAVRLRVKSASVRRLLCGAVAGAFSRTCVAPLETVRTHLMVGSGGQTVSSVVQHIMTHDGWQGLFRGNGVNVIRVAPSKAIEVSLSSTRHDSWFPDTYTDIATAFCDPRGFTNRTLSIRCDVMKSKAREPDSWPWVRSVVNEGTIAVLHSLLSLF